MLGNNSKDYFLFTDSELRHSREVQSKFSRSIRESYGVGRCGILESFSAIRNQAQAFCREILTTVRVARGEGIWYNLTNGQGCYKAVTGLLHPVTWCYLLLHLDNKNQRKETK
jgi:hypothetical protein